MTLTTFVKRPPGSIEWRRTAAKFIKFGVVGVSGLVINTVALLFTVDGLGIDYLVGVTLATQVSTAWNFVFSELWVFDGSPGLKAKLNRFTRFWLLNNTALLLRGPIIWILTDGLSVHYAISNLISLTLIMILRYTISDRLIWSRINKPETVNRTEGVTYEAELDHAAGRPLFRPQNNGRYGNGHDLERFPDDESDRTTPRS